MKLDFTAWIQTHAVCNTSSVNNLAITSNTLLLETMLKDFITFKQYFVTACVHILPH